MDEPSLRKPFGMLLILLWIILWAVIVLALATPVLRAAWPVQALFFTVVGIGWIAPLKPLLRWMETGSFR